MRFRLMTGTVFSTVTFAALAAAAHAQQAAPLQIASVDDNDRNKVTITATRIEQPVDEVPATVSVITGATGGHKD